MSRIFSPVIVFCSAPDRLITAEHSPMSLLSPFSFRIVEAYLRSRLESRSSSGFVDGESGEEDGDIGAEVMSEQLSSIAMHAIFPCPHSLYIHRIARASASETAALLSQIYPEIIRNLQEALKSALTNETHRFDRLNDSSCNRFISIHSQTWIG